MKLSNTKSLILDKIVADIAFMKTLATWLEDHDAEWSEKLNDVSTRYEVVSGAYLTHLRASHNCSVVGFDEEKFKRENI